MNQQIFLEIGIIILMAALFAYFGRAIRQPLIPFYILAGLVLGPILNLINNANIILTLSEIGIAFLLFIVGLEMDLRKLKDVEHVTIFGGLVQILGTFTIGFIISLFLGYYSLEAFYMGLIVTFSSTMVVLKILSDKRQIDSLHGRIIIGLLLMQDIAAVLVLSFLNTLDAFSFAAIGFSVVKGVAIFAIALFCGHFVFPLMFRFAARTQELLFLLALAILFGFSLLFNMMGFSIAIGAFVAGLSLANLSYSLDIMAKAKPLRDFFAIIFFVSLGIQIELEGITSLIFPIIVFLVLLVIIKPLILTGITSFFGYKERTSFTVGNSLGQSSEFSLIMVSAGLAYGHIRQELFTLVVVLTTITIGLTSYAKKYEEKMLQKFGPFLKRIDRFTYEEDDLSYHSKELSNHVVLIGYNRIGFSIVKTIKKINKSIFVIDYNPEVIKKLIRQKVHCMYGDASSEDIIERMNLKHAKFLISTTPVQHDNEMLIHKAREINDKLTIIVTAFEIDEALKLYKLGADYVIIPHLIGGDHLSTLLEKNYKRGYQLDLIKGPHMKELFERLALGKDHPEHR